ERKTSLPSFLALANASSPQGYQSTGLWACWSRYGLISPANRLALRTFPSFGLGSSGSVAKPNGGTIAPTRRMPSTARITRDSSRESFRHVPLHSDKVPCYAIFHGCGRRSQVLLPAYYQDEHPVLTSEA